QIRVHLAHIGHPVLGDPQYGPQKCPFGLSGQLLHAGKIGFIQPSTGEYLEFEVSPEEIFLSVLRKLRQRY
ncbi:MAG: RNA pseudouridine synthase, partial [bacterium]|nr:RNA pseudouridine synthase [bacterium]